MPHHCQYTTPSRFNIHQLVNCWNKQEFCHKQSFHTIIIHYQTKYCRRFKEYLLKSEFYVDFSSPSDCGGWRGCCQHRGQEWFGGFSGPFLLIIFTDTRGRGFHSWFCSLHPTHDLEASNNFQISSNGENVIGESVTRHFTGEFSVYSMAVRLAGRSSKDTCMFYHVITSQATTTSR